MAPLGVTMTPLGWKSLERGTAKIDWCEENYAVHPYIAEFYNTISNAPFLVVSPILFYLYIKYYVIDTRKGLLVWFIIFNIGIWSAYFHATLSLVGQLLDEICILWAIIAALTVWLPDRYLPRGYLRKRSRNTWLVFIGVIFLTILCFLNPAINAVALLTTGAPLSLLVYNETKRTENERAKELGRRVLTIWPAAVTTWVLDRILCELWLAVRLTYLHSVWHILACIAGCQACVLMSFFYAESVLPPHQVAVRYWPDNSLEFLEIPFGIPYVTHRKYGDDMYNNNCELHIV